MIDSDLVNIDGEIIDMCGATWQWMPGFSEQKPRLRNGNLAIYAYIRTQKWGKSEIAVWIPDAVNQGCRFDPCQQRIADTPKNWEYCVSGGLWAANDIDF